LHRVLDTIFIHSHSSDPFKPAALSRGPSSHHRLHTPSDSPNYAEKPAKWLGSVISSRRSAIK
ncbi:MAG: hypothetical protein WC184_08745, partial [Acidimicrobiia bacterium]